MLQMAQSPLCKFRQCKVPYSAEISCSTFRRQKILIHPQLFVVQVMFILFVMSLVTETVERKESVIISFLHPTFILLNLCIAEQMRMKLSFK